MCDMTLRVVYTPELTNAIYDWRFTNAPGSAPNGTTNFDLVAGAPAVVRGNGATYTSNALRIPGGSIGNAAIGSVAAYIDLPNHILSAQTNITIEIWATPKSVQNWGRIMDFGRTTEAGDGLGAVGEWTGLPGAATPNNTSQSDGIMLSSSIGTDLTQQRFEARHNGAVYTVNTALATTAGVQHHYAITFTDGLGAFGSAGGRWQWYRDGDIVEFLDVSNHLAAIQDVNNWLGRSEWSADSLANADYTEVRISNVALNQWQVKANYLLGPNYAPRSTTMKTSDLWNGGTRSFNTAGNWSDGLAPGAGKSYDLSDFNLTTPNNTTPYTFAGDSLHASGGIFFCGASGSTTISVNKFQVDNEEICNTASGTFNLAGNLYVTNACILRGAGGPVNVSANLNGNGSLTFYASAVSLTGNNTNFTGKVRIGNGIIGNMNLSSEAQLGANPPSFTPDQLILNRGWLYTTSSLTISNSNRGILIGVNDGIFDEAAGTTLTLGCPLSSGETIVSAGQMTMQAEPAGIVAGQLIKQNSGTLVLTSSNPNYNGGLLISGGTLAIAGAGQLGGGAFGNPFADNGIFSYSSTANQSISSAIGGSGSLVKNNSSTLVLSGANTFTGATTINGGTLLVNGSVGSGAMKVAGGQLAGNGTIGGLLTVQSGGTLSPGSGIGTLTVNNGVALQSGSTTWMEISKTQNANDQLVVSGALTYGGTLVVSNVSGTFAAGDSFKVFQAGAIAGSFGSVSLPALSAGLGWNTANLNSGVIGVIHTTPTNLVWNLSGTNLDLSWPTDYVGWRLQIQTNPINAGLGTNWIDVPGSTTTNNVTLPVDATVGNVFYRMVYP
jgi:autotransporter-associated beta strand protein